MELANDAHHLFGLRRLAERRPAGEIGEDDRDLAAVALEQVIRAGREGNLRELGRQESAEPAEPLDLADLARDP